MNINSLNRAMLLAGLCGFTMTSPAGPLRRADVPADPAWVVHLDCDALRRSTIGKFIMEETDKPEAKAKLAALQAIIGVDIRNQVHGVTIYSASSSKEDGVLIINADIDADRLVTLAKAASEYRSSEHGSHTIHTWIDDKKKDKKDESGSKPRVYASIAGSRVIFSQREETVAKALDVIDGGASLAGTKTFPDLGVAGTTSFIQGAARKLDISGSDPNAAVFRMSKLIQLDVGEAAQRASATLTLTASDEDTAKNIAAIAQGLLALVRLQKDNPDAMKLADAISLKQDGAVTVCTVSMPAADVVGLMKADAARKAQAAQAEKN